MDWVVSWLKIIESDKMAFRKRSDKERANAGCHKCPCCGEEKTFAQYISEGVFDKGLSGAGVCRTWAEGFIRIKHMKCDCYYCKTCGARWESDPYQY